MSLVDEIYNKTQSTTTTKIPTGGITQVGGIKLEPTGTSLARQQLQAVEPPKKKPGIVKNFLSEAYDIGSGFIDMFVARPIRSVVSGEAPQDIYNEVVNTVENLKFGAEIGAKQMYDLATNFPSRTKQVIKDINTLRNLPRGEALQAFREFEDDIYSNPDVSFTTKLAGGLASSLATRLGKLGTDFQETIVQEPLSTALDIVAVGDALKVNPKIAKRIADTKTAQIVLDSWKEGKRVGGVLGEALQQSESPGVRAVGGAIQKVVNRDVINKFRDELGTARGLNKVEANEMKAFLRSQLDNLDELETKDLTKVREGLASTLSENAQNLLKTFEDTVAKPIQDYLIKTERLTPETARVISYQPLFKASGIELIENSKFAKGLQLTRKRADEFIKRFADDTEVMGKAGQLPELTPIKDRQIITKQDQANIRKLNKLDEVQLKGENLSREAINEINRQISSLTQELQDTKLSKTKVQKKIENAINPLSKFVKKREMTLLKDRITNYARGIREGITQGIEKEKLLSKERAMRFPRTIKDKVNEIRSDINTVDAIPTVQRILRDSESPGYITHVRDSANTAQDIISRIQAEFPKNSFIRNIIDEMPVKQKNELNNGSTVTGMRFSEPRIEALKTRGGLSESPKDFAKAAGKMIDMYTKLKSFDDQMNIILRYADELKPGETPKAGYKMFAPANLKRELKRLNMETRAISVSTVQDMFNNVFKSFEGTQPLFNKSDMKMYQIPEWLVKEVTDRYVPKSFIKHVLYDNVTDAWRSLVLALRPAWTVNDAIGSAFLNFLGGVGIDDYFKIMDGQIKSKLPKELGMADIYGTIDLANSSLNKGPLSTVMKGLKNKDPVAIAKGTVQLPKKLVEAGTQLNRTVNQVFRDARYINAISDDIVKFAKQNDILLTRQKFLELMDDTKFKQNALDKVKDTLPGFQEMSHFEREYVRTFMPFYSWKKFVVTKGLPLIFGRPIRSKLLMTANNIREAEKTEEEKQRPDYLQGRIPITENLEYESTYQNVFGGLDDNVLSGLNPIVTAVLENAMKKDLFTQKLFTSPDLPSEYDVLGVPYEERPTVPVVRGIVQSIPQYRLYKDLQTGARRFETTGDVILDTKKFPELEAKSPINRAIVILNYLGIPLKEVSEDPRTEKQKETAAKRSATTEKKRKERLQKQAEFRATQ